MWTDERVDELKILWDEGVSTMEIGRRLGMSKNAIIGKAHRIGLKPRRASKRMKSARVIRLAGQGCQWPTGDPLNEDFNFCGEPCAQGKSYCEDHYAQAYIAGSTRRENKTARAG